MVTTTKVHYFVALFLVCLPVIVYGYGEANSQDLPSYAERTAMALLNAARISPSAYATNYIAGSGFFASTAGAFQSAPGLPLMIDDGLTAGAHSHSTDLTTNCPGQLINNMCDGTAWYTNLNKYFTCSSSLGQLLFGGSTDALYVMNYMLCRPKQSGSSYVCCADSDTSCNSLRNYAFSTSFQRGGAGVSGSTWTWDFSSCAADSHPITSGSHIFINGNLRYIAQWRDTSGQAPTSASVNIFSGSSWTAQSLTLDGGSPSLGNYAYQEASPASCKYYYFTFVTGGNTVRYPDTGYFATYDGGACSTNFVADNPTSTAEVPSSPTGLTAGTTTTTTIPLSWTAPDNGGSAIFDYVVYYRTTLEGSFSTVQVGSTTTSYTLSGLLANNTYIVAVAAINSVGTGTASSTLAVSTASSGSQGTCNDASCLPASYNSRTDTSCTGPGIYNQGQCGSCYSFATAAAGSDRECRNGGAIVAVSPQDILDCGYGSPYNVFSTQGGCGGGVMYYAGQLMCGRGLGKANNNNLNSGCRPYKCANGCDGSNIPACSTTCDDGSAYTTTGCTDYYQLPNDNSAVMLDIYNHGPVVAGFHVCQSFYDWFDSYPGYETYPYDCSPSSSDYVGGHAVSVVGWWVDGDGVQAWIAANSWGTGWASWNGYFSLPFNKNGLSDFGFVAASHGWAAPRGVRQNANPRGTGEVASSDDSNSVVKAAAQLGLDDWWFRQLVNNDKRRSVDPSHEIFEDRQAASGITIVSTANPYTITQVSGASTQAIAGQKVSASVEATNAAGKTINLDVEVIYGLAGATTVASTGGAAAGGGGAAGLSTAALIGIIVGSSVGGLLIIGALTVLLIVAVVFTTKAIVSRRSEDYDPEPEAPVEMNELPRKKTFMDRLPNIYSPSKHQSITARGPSHHVERDPRSLAV